MVYFNPSLHGPLVLSESTLSHTDSSTTFTHFTYTQAYNILDWCGTSIPVTFTQIGVDDKPEYTPRNNVEKKIWERYTSKESEGAPAAVQVVGMRLEEEHLVAVTRVVDEALTNAGRAKL
jgi:amidase